MGSNPLSRMANSVVTTVVDTRKMAEEAAHRQAKLLQEAHAANSASYGASSAYDELGRKYERFADVLIKGRDEVQREKERLYISQLDQHPLTSTSIRSVPIAPPHTTSVHTTTQIPYGQATPAGSPHLHPTTAPYSQVHQFPYGQATPPASPQMYATAPSHGQVPQLSNLEAANQAQALAQQPGLSLADQKQLFEENQLMQAYLAQQAENSQKANAPFANEAINPQQKVAADHDMEVRPSKGLVTEFLNRDLDLMPYKAFKEDHPQTRQKIEALASELPTPIEITSKIPFKNHPLGKSNLLNEKQQLNDQRTHILKLINSSKQALGNRTDVERYGNELNRITTDLQAISRRCQTQEFLNKEDSRKLSSHAAQLSQTTEHLRAILNNHRDHMPTTHDQAQNFTEYHVALNRTVKNDFSDAYPEAKTDIQKESLIRKLRQYNREIRDYLTSEMPNPESTGDYNQKAHDDMLKRIQPITSKEIDSLTEYKKADLRIGDAFKVGALGGALTLAAASFAKATGITGLTQPILRLGFGGTAASMLFSTLPSKIKEPIMQGEPTKALENLFQRGQAKSWLMPDEPKHNSPASKHIKYGFFSQF